MTRQYLRTTLIPTLVVLIFVHKIAGFAPPSIRVCSTTRVLQHQVHLSPSPSSSTTSTGTTTTTTLWMAAAGGGKSDGGKKKRRRRRKAPPGAVAPDPVRTSLERIEGDDDDEDASGDGDDDDEDLLIGDDVGRDAEFEKEDLLQISDVAKFEFKPDNEIRIPDDMNAEIGTGTSPPPPPPPSAQQPAAPAKSDNAIPLPDIRDARRKKQLEKELMRMAEEKEETRVKIKRSDKVAFNKLLEQQPFADADDSYFEQEEYGTVSALLGEGAKPFLGIPTGPLQVGHFIGALGIMLMAFVEYPGFPLTNLPTPIREALQGGLFVVFSINTVLAVLATFKAGERGQSKLLWGSKTFAVGGLAYDQLTQLPTLDQIEQRKAIKGKRALKTQRK